MLVCPSVLSSSAEFCHIRPCGPPWAKLERDWRCSAGFAGDVFFRGRLDVDAESIRGSIPWSIRGLAGAQSQCRPQPFFSTAPQGESARAAPRERPSSDAARRGARVVPRRVARRRVARRRVAASVASRSVAEGLHGGGGAAPAGARGLHRRDPPGGGPAARRLPPRLDGVCGVGPLRHGRAAVVPLARAALERMRGELLASIVRILNCIHRHTHTRIPRCL